MEPLIPRISKKEKKRLLNSRVVVARLATTSKHHKPHVVPVWFLNANSRIYVPSPSRTLKVRNILRNPYVSVTFDSYDGVLNAKGLLAEGKAKILNGSDSAEINLRIHRKYVGSERLKHRGWKQFAAEDDATIVIYPKKWKSWDFSKLKL